MIMRAALGAALALGLLEDEEITWFWIGTHAEYDRLLENLQLCSCRPNVPLSGREASNASPRSAGAECWAAVESLNDLICS